MTRVPTATANTAANPTTKRGDNGLGDVDLDQFLQLLISELQNQDPLNPLDNSEMLQQISQIREIGATDKLSSTLTTVLRGQNLSTASNLIGQEIDALADDGSNVKGLVDRVSMQEDDKGVLNIRVHVGDKKIQLDKIRGIGDVD